MTTQRRPHTFLHLIPVALPPLGAFPAGRVFAQPSAGREALAAHWGPAERVHCPADPVGADRGLAC